MQPSLNREDMQSGLYFVYIVFQIGQASSSRDWLIFEPEAAWHKLCILEIKHILLM